MKHSHTLFAKEIFRIFERRHLFYRMYIKCASIKQIIYLSKIGINILNKPKVYPFSVLLAITYKCQCDCTHCGVVEYKDENKQELSLEQIKEIISELKKLGIANVTLTGGEPLLRTEIFDIIKHISKQGIIVTLDTNGLLLNTPTIIRLKKSGLNLLKVSIDSSYPPIHDAIRSMKGCFKKAVNGLKSSVELKLPCVIQTCISHNTVKRDDLRKIINLAKRLNTSGVCVQSVKASGKWKSYHSPNQNINNYIKKSLDPTYVYFSNIISEFLQSSTLSKKEFYISAYGDLQPSMFVPLFFGNVKEKGVEDIWSRMITHPIYKLSPDKCLLSDFEIRNKPGF